MDPFGPRRPAGGRFVPRVEALPQAVAERAVELAVSALDLNALLDWVDLNALLDRIDLNRVLARVGRAGGTAAVPVPGLIPRHPAAADDSQHRPVHAQCDLLP